MTTSSSSIKERTEPVKPLGSTDYEETIDSSLEDALGFILQEPLSAAYTMGEEVVTTPPDALVPAESGKLTGLDAVFGFQEIINALLAEAAKALSKMEEYQRIIGENILNKIQAKVDEIEQQKAQQEAAKKKTFWDLLKDVAILVTPGVKEVMAIVNSANSDEDFFKSLGNVYKDTAISITENPALGTVLQVLQYTAMALMAGSAFLTGGFGALAIMAVMTIMTQVQFPGSDSDDKKTALAWISTGISEGLVESGIIKDEKAANWIADGLTIALTLAVSGGAGAASATIRTSGIMLTTAGSTLGALSENIATDIVDSAGLTGAEREYVKMAITMGLSLVALAMSAKGASMMGKAPAQNERAKKYAKLLTGIMRMTYTVEMMTGSLQIIQAGGSIAIALINKFIQELQAQIMELSEANTRANVGAESLQKNAKSSLESLNESVMTSSSAVPQGLTSFKLN